MSTLSPIPRTYPEPPSQPVNWDVIIFDPATGNELYLNAWLSIDVTQNFEGIEVQIQVPGSRPELDGITELVTDLLLYVYGYFAFRVRVMDVSDNLTGEAHSSTIIGRSYEAILQRRVLFSDYVPSGVDQHDIAWNLVSYTQQFQTLGLTRVSGTSGQNRDRVIQKGQTISEAINEVAQTDNGFDWWIDENLGFHMQTPRRIRDTNFYWMYGSQIVNLDRTGAAEIYASVIMSIGATNETNINGTIYPPPPPAIRELTTKPYGRWERTVSYSDIVTAQSVIDKALWALAESSLARSDYKITLVPTLYRAGLILPGDVLTLRVQSLPRLDFEVDARIEEISISVDADGKEVVECGLRAESSERPMSSKQVVRSVPAGPDPRSPVITPQAEVIPPGSVLVNPTAPNGRTRTVSMVSATGRFMTIIRDLERRLTRQEHST